jgi:hypothetical protein
VKQRLSIPRLSKGQGGPCLGTRGNREVCHRSRSATSYYYHNFLLNARSSQDKIIRFRCHRSSPSESGDFAINGYFLCWATVNRAPCLGRTILRVKAAQPRYAKGIFPINVLLNYAQRLNTIPQSNSSTKTHNYPAVSVLKLAPTNTTRTAMHAAIMAAKISL